MTTLDGNLHEHTFCEQCNEWHVTSPTVDSTKNVVGYFCHRTRLMAFVVEQEWNGVDLMPFVREFIVEHVDFKALVRMRTERMTVLAKKLAYYHMNTPQARELRFNYAVMQWHYTQELTKIHERLTGAKEGE